MDVDAEPQSLVVVVSYDIREGLNLESPYFCSILHFDEPQPHEYDNQVIDTQFSVNFLHPQPPLPEPLQPTQLTRPDWFFSPLAGSTVGSSTEDLYLLPDWGFDNEKLDPFDGWIYNLRTKKYKRIKAPCSPNGAGHVVTIGGRIYLVEYPRPPSERFPVTVIERYNPPSDSWEDKIPLPYIHDGFIQATAVLDDTILLNFSGIIFWAYNVLNNKWYDVMVEDKRIYCIRGEAVVLGNTIYALESGYFNVVLVFKVGRKLINDDLVFHLYEIYTIWVSGMKDIEFENEDRAAGVSWSVDLRHLAYLGKGNFCIVRSSHHLCPYEYQGIQVINIKLEGEYKMTVKNTRFHKLKIEGKKQFRIRRCFPLPKWKTAALEEGKPSVVKFDLDHAEEETTEEGIKPVQDEKAAEGRSVAFQAHIEEPTPFYIPQPPPQQHYNQPYMPPIPHHMQAGTPFYIPQPPPPQPSNQPYMPPIPPPLLPYPQTVPTPHPNTNPCPLSGYQVSCQFCGVFGHTAVRCPTYPFFHRLPIPTTWPNAIPTPLHASSYPNTYPCQFCGVFGHTAVRCPTYPFFHHLPFPPNPTPTTWPNTIPTLHASSYPSVKI